MGRPPTLVESRIACKGICLARAIGRSMRIINCPTIIWDRSFRRTRKGRMEFHLKSKCCRGSAVMTFVLLGAPAVFAQTDEIQVYDAEIADQGVFNLMLHTNYTPIGRKTADFSGGIIPNHSVNGALEWAYGVEDWFEQGLYLPVESAYSQGRGGSINGFKIRELFVRPHAEDHTFFYGVNFEFSVNYLYWEPRHY